MNEFQNPLVLLGPEILDAIVAAQRWRNQVINFVVTGMVVGDAVFGGKPAV
jgi:hypothetical protein